MRGATAVMSTLRMPSAPAAISRSRATIASAMSALTSTL